MRFNISTDVRLDEGILVDIEKCLPECNGKKLLFVVDANLKGSTYFNSFASKLNGHATVTEYVVELDGEPTYGLLGTIQSELRGKEFDFVLSCGGGSTMDIGKGISLLLSNPRQPIQLRGFPTDLEPPVRHITAPSLLGSGAEISFNAVFIDEKESRKFGINSRQNYPYKALIDPVLASEAPMHSKRNAAFDCLVHCNDSFGNPRASSITRSLSQTGFSAAFEALTLGLATVESMTRLAIGSCCGVMALMNSGDGPTNGFAYYLGVTRNIPHGLAGAIFLRSVLYYNIDKGYKEAIALLHQFDSRVDEQSFYTYLDSLYTKYDIPTLKELGFEYSDIDPFLDGAEAALKGSFGGNPITFDRGSAEQVFRSLI